MYDIFYIGKQSIDDESWSEFSKRFPRAQKVENVQSLDQLKAKSFTKFFWVVPDDITILDDFDFSYIVPIWDETYINVFKNGKYYNGVAIFSKNHSISKKEWNNRFFINRKEIDILASIPKYSLHDILYVSSENANETDWNQFRRSYPRSKIVENVKSFDDIKAVSDTNLFWVVWDDIEILKDFNFEYQIPPWDEKYVHVFRNGKYYNGVTIFSKEHAVSQREWDFRFFTNKKEINLLASVPKETIFDIIFLSYDEPYADENFKKLQDRFPNAKRVHGVKGLHQAHIKAAEISETEMFWVVDADAEVLDTFNFDFIEPERFTVYVWNSINPINGLEYGYGGVKLFPKRLALNMQLNTTDVTTSVSIKFERINYVSNITRFNVDAFSTWRSAFRECAKLSSKVIDRNYEPETDLRLETWCTIGEDKPYGKYAIAGAIEGKKFGEINIGNTEVLCFVNDFEWLKDRFDKWKESNE
jgi:hypothetical protein